MRNATPRLSVPPVCATCVWAFGDQLRIRTGTAAIHMRLRKWNVLPHTGNPAGMAPYLGGVRITADVGVAVDENRT